MRRSSLIFLPLVLVAACGDDDDDSVSFDAGRADARPVDASPVDASDIDGGPIDAAPIDASIDAAPIDASIDAAPADASIDAAPPVDHDIRDLQTGAIATGSDVRVAGAVVTARTDTTGSTSLYIQEPTGAAPNSGIFVFVDTSPAPSFALPEVGDLVVVEGELDEFGTAPNTRTNIDPVTSITVIGTGTIPDAVVVPAAELVKGTETAEQWEGVLVKVENVTVASRDPQFQEFLLVGGPEVDDRLFSYPLPFPGDTFTAITGPLDEAFGTMRILPRRAADLEGLVSAPPALVSLTPPSATIGEDESVTLTVAIDRPAPAGGTQIALDSDAETVAVPATDSVIVAAGATSASFEVEARAAGTANISAGLAGASETSVITVDSLPPAIAGVAPATIDLLAAGGTGILTVSLTKPAEAGGFNVAITSGDAGIAVPAQLIIPEGKRSGTFRLRADTMTAIGPVTVNAGTASATANVVLAGTAPVVGDLVINEVNYDVPMTGGDTNCDGTTSNTADADEFVELVNVSNHPLSMAGVGVWDSGTTTRFAFPAFTLGPGEAAVVFGAPFGADIDGTSPWCAGITATTIGDAAAFGDKALGLGNSGDTVRVTAGPTTDSTELARVQFGTGHDNALVRSPDITGEFVEHNTAPEHATDRGWTPGTRLTGASWADARP